MRRSPLPATPTLFDRKAMQVLVDADACPVVVKDILFRAARRTEVCVTLVANQYLRTPPSPFLTSSPA